MGSVLAGAFRERNLSEYEPIRPVPDDLADELLGQARWFLEKIRTFLAEDKQG